MKQTPAIVERYFEAPVEKVWDALTINEQIKKWYLQLDEFIPEVGFEFEFWGGEEGGPQYHHKCRIVEVILHKRLSYTWRFEGYEGDSVVTFELFEEGARTRLLLTHSGIESFAGIGKGFAPEDFMEGWGHLVNTSLAQFVRA
jgi:uncharacterized protein YndB with AHSA1/START domain